MCTCALVATAFAEPKLREMRKLFFLSYNKELVGKALMLLKKIVSLLSFIKYDLFNC